MAKKNVKRQNKQTKSQAALFNLQALSNSFCVIVPLNYRLRYEEKTTQAPQVLLPLWTQKNMCSFSESVKQDNNFSFIKNMENPLTTKFFENRGIFSGGMLSPWVKTDPH